MATLFVSLAGETCARIFSHLRPPGVTVMASLESRRYTRERDGEEFLIIASPQKRDDPNGYSLDFTIERNVGGQRMETEFHAANTFDSEDEAIEGCFEAARMIIDGKVPELYEKLP